MLILIFCQPTFAVKAQVWCDDGVTNFKVDDDLSTTLPPVKTIYSDPSIYSIYFVKFTSSALKHFWSHPSDEPQICLTDSCPPNMVTEVVKSVKKTNLVPGGKTYPFGFYRATADDGKFYACYVRGL